MNATCVKDVCGCVPDTHAPTCAELVWHVLRMFMVVCLVVVCHMFTSVKLVPCLLGMLVAEMPHVRASVCTACTCGDRSSKIAIRNAQELRKSA